MLLTSPRIQSVFGDKSSLIVRALLREPDRRWTSRQLVGEGASLGLVSAVLHDLENSGFISRHASGRFSYSRLISSENLLTAWTQSYRFHKNPQAQFYSADPNVLKKIRKFFEEEKIPYALTLFSAANRIAPYVVDHTHALYIGVPERQAESFPWRLS